MSYEEFVAQLEQRFAKLDQLPYETEGPTLEAPELRRIMFSERAKIWTGRRGIIAIDLDQDNHVSWKQFQVVRWINGNTLDRLRDWLGW